MRAGTVIDICIDVLWWILSSVIGSFSVVCCGGGVVLHLDVGGGRHSEESSSPVASGSGEGQEARNNGGIFLTDRTWMSVGERDLI